MARTPARLGGATLHAVGTDPEHAIDAASAVSRQASSIQRSDDTQCVFASPLRRRLSAVTSGQSRKTPAQGTFFQTMFANSEKNRSGTSNARSRVDRLARSQGPAHEDAAHSGDQLM